MGGLGHDLILPGSGNDVLRGGPRPDHVFGGIGDDILRGGRASDNLVAQRGRDILRGGLGEDLLSPQVGRDGVRGGYGRDVVFLGARGSRDLIDCWARWDRVLYTKRADPKDVIVSCEQQKVFTG